MKIFVKAIAQQGFYRAGLFFPHEGRVIDPDDLTDAQKKAIAEEPHLTWRPHDDVDDDLQSTPLADAGESHPIEAVVDLGDKQVPVQIVGQDEGGNPIVTEESFANLQAEVETSHAATSVATDAQPASAPEAKKDEPSKPQQAPRQASGRQGNRASK